MKDDWKNNIKPTPSTYALHADPNKPLRDAHHVIRSLNDRLEETTRLLDERDAEIKHLRASLDNMRETTRIEERRLNAQLETVITERGVYRRLLRDILHLKD